MRAKYGQHFLVDQESIRVIVESARITPSDHVVEIGPGRGALTAHLNSLSERLTLVEPDSDLTLNLRLYNPKAEIIVGNAEEQDYLALDGPLVVVSNLPYYASVQIYKRLTEQKENISRMVLMFQKEVAQRISAAPGGRHYGSLSVWSAYNWEIENIISLPPSSFKPPPKVDSAVLRFRPRLTPPIEADEKKLFRLIRASFVQKRRIIANNLKNIYTPDSVKQALSEAGLNATERAERITLEQFGVMSRFLREIE
jgi:16S rRNA (adenine1518-N6/adenine1519-N6)-dimethyltransferase